MKIMDKETMEPIYDQRVNDTLAGLLSGETREALAESFNLANWKSLDIYMRRKGFVWDSHNQTYIPATTRVDTILEELDTGNPVKADMIIRRFEEMGDDSDPRSIARDFGFTDHRELGEYMESKQLFWNSETNNYGVMFDDTPVESVAETDNLNNNVFQRQKSQKSGITVSDHAEPQSPQELQDYLPILDVLIQNKDRLLSLLMPESTGTIPRYAIPGTPKTQSLYMSDLLSRILKEFSESQNLKQREVVEGALIEYFKRYGYQREVDKLLQKR
ncbi:hypothetical protein LNN31_04200 [Acetobacterium wieringae]|uniref:Uncharacterized protein n=1 Tax=Acetobacterium wieringae TaxID=52694 RepID=A0ABY6HJG2_9FIRM|nr:hypothetical protein [Acetobacterium wieringae]UYO63641.1 hypothetical protein LNN31_04200 [Acetobacterium wieringae]